MTTFDAILPAGGAIDAEFAARVGTTAKALIPFEGRTILRRTLDALEGTGRINRTILVGTPEVLSHVDADGVSERVPSGTSGPDTIFRGLKHLATLPNPPQKVLIVTADLPYLTPEVIVRFLDQCPPDGDICVPLISKSEFHARFPGSGGTFVPLKGETLTAGCAYVFDVDAFKTALPHMERLFQNRKSKIGMVRLLGAGFLVKFLTKTLTIEDIEAKVERLLGCSGSVILNAPPEFAFDIDDLEDYDYALKHLTAHGNR